MKKLLLFLLLLPALAMAQQTRPTTPVQKPQNTPYLDTSTGIRWFFDGTVFWPVAPYNPTNMVMSGLSLSVVSNTLTVHTGSWRINNIIYSLGSNTDLTLQDRDSVLYRYEAVYATGANNSIGLKVGSQSLTPIQPTVGADTLIVGLVLIAPDGTSVFPPGPASDFVFSHPTVKQLDANPWTRTFRTDTLKIGGQYIFPARRGLSGQVLQDDGMGNLFWSYQATYLPGFGLNLTAQTFSVDTDLMVTTVALRDTLLRHAAHFDTSQFIIANDTIHLIGGGGGAFLPLLFPADQFVNMNGHFLEIDALYNGNGTYMRLDSLNGLCVNSGGFTNSQRGSLTVDTLESTVSYIDGSGGVTYIASANHLNGAELSEFNGSIKKGLFIIDSENGEKITDPIDHYGLFHDNSIDRNTWTNNSYVDKRWSDSLYNSLTASNGLTRSANDFQLGGTLSGFTGIDMAGNGFEISNFVNTNSSLDFQINTTSFQRQLKLPISAINYIFTEIAQANTYQLAISKGGVVSSLFLNNSNAGVEIRDPINLIGGIYSADYSTNQRLRRLSIPSVGTVIALVDSVKGTIAGGVSSVAATGANGIGVSGSPITATGTLAFSLGNITPTTISTTIKPATIYQTAAGTAGTDSVMVKHSGGIVDAISPTFYATSTANALKLNISDTAAMAYVHINKAETILGPKTFSSSILLSANATQNFGSTGNNALNTFTNNVSSNTALTLSTSAANSIIFSQNSSETARFNASARLLIGTTTDDLVNKVQVNGKLYATGVSQGYTPTAAAGGTTTLTASSNALQYITGTTANQIIVLPAVSGLILGQTFTIANTETSTGIVTVQSSGANTIFAQAGGSVVTYTVISTSGTTAASWASSYTPGVTSQGANANVNLHASGTGIIQLSPNNAVGIYGRSGSSFDFWDTGLSGGNAFATFSSGFVTFQSGTALDFSSSVPNSAGGDVGVYRSAAGVLGVGTGTTGTFATIIAALHTARTDAIATTLTDGLYINNTTAATSGVPNQYSGNLHFRAEVWNTTATAANNFTDWIQYVSTTSSATPSSTFILASSLTTTTTPSYSSILTITKDGNLNLNGSVSTLNAAVASIAGQNKGGYFLSNSTGGVGGFNANSSGSFFWKFDNVDAHSAALGYSTAQTTFTNKILTWNDSGNVLLSGGLNIAGLTASKIVFTDASKNLTSTGIGTSSQFIAGDGSLITIGQRPHTIFTPTTGGTVALTNNQYNIINPAGALLALTVNLPSSPANNDCVFIKFTQSVTTVTYGNGTVVDGITAPTAGGLTVLTYDSGTTSWY